MRYVPSSVVVPFVTIFKLLVPLWACSVDEVIMVLVPALTNPVVVPRVSVPVCWLGVSSSELYPVVMLTVMLVGVLFTVSVVVLVVPR